MKIHHYLFATVLQAMGVNPHSEYQVGARPIHLVNPGIQAISPLLA